MTEHRTPSEDVARHEIDALADRLRQMGFGVETLRRQLRDGADRLPVETGDPA